MAYILWFGARTVVSIPALVHAGWPWKWHTILGRDSIFLFFKALKPALGTNQLPIQWEFGFCFSDSTVTRVWCWTPKHAKAKNTWNYTSPFPYFLTWCLFRYRDFLFIYLKQYRSVHRKSFILKQIVYEIISKLYRQSMPVQSMPIHLHKVAGEWHEDSLTTHDP